MHYNTVCNLRTLSLQLSAVPALKKKDIFGLFLTELKEKGLSHSHLLGQFQGNSLHANN